MGRLSESMAVKCKLAAVPILKMHLRLTRSAATQRQRPPYRPGGGIPQAGAESRTVRTLEVTENSQSPCCRLSSNVQQHTGPTGAGRMVHVSLRPH